MTEKKLCFYGRRRTIVTDIFPWVRILHAIKKKNKIKKIKNKMKDT